MISQTKSVDRALATLESVRASGVIPAADQSVASAATRSFDEGAARREISVNVLWKPTEVTEMQKYPEWLDLAIEDMIFSASRGILPVGLERYEDKTKPDDFFGLDDAAMAQEVGRRTHSLVVLQLDPALAEISLRFGDPRKQKIGLGGECGLCSVPPAGIKRILAPEPIYSLVCRVFDKSLVTSVPTRTETRLRIKLPKELDTNDPRWKAHPVFGVRWLEAILVPDFEGTIRGIAAAAFGTLNDPADKRECQIWHVLRLTSAIDQDFSPPAFVEPVPSVWNRQRMREKQAQAEARSL